MKIPIAFKLVAITLLILLAATIPIAFKSSKLFEDVSGKREEDSNRNQASTRATEVDGLFTSYIDKAKVVASLLMQKSSGKLVDEAIQLSFNQDRDLVSVSLWVMKENKPFEDQVIVSDTYLTQHELSKDYIKVLRSTKPFPLTSSFTGNIEVRNSSVADGAPIITMSFPLVKDDYGRITHVALADFRLDRLQKSFATVSERTVYLVDKDGVVLAHPDDKLAMQAANLKKSPIVEKAMGSKLSEGQMRFEDPVDKKIFVGAFARNSFGVSVVAQAPEEVIMEAARSVRRQAFFITGLAISLSVFLIFWFSVSLTTPLEKLLDITHQIAKGNFDVSAKASIKGRDEVGELANAFDEMTVGLRERDKMKNVLNKFHGSAVAEDMLSGDVGLSGQKKYVTVFFSDIRDFTKFSEGHSPEEVVAMLNEYFHVMVGIINRHGGVVDKFIGDAIMAIWGAPKGTDRDPQKAMQAALEMRKSLAELNESRLARGLTEIKIGIGLHSGEAISGTIGSDERMEYTVIGDTVNMASRIEASTKSFGTDLLVSQITADIGKEEFILEYAGAAEVKGKSEPLKLYKIRGFYDENKNPVLIKTKYSDYEAGHDAKVKVA